MVSMPTKRVDGEDSSRSLGSECMTKLDSVFFRAGRKISNKERLHNELFGLRGLRHTQSHEQRTTILNWQSMISPEGY